MSVPPRPAHSIEDERHNVPPVQQLLPEVDEETVVVDDEPSHGIEQ